MSDKASSICFKLIDAAVLIDFFQSQQKGTIEGKQQSIEAEFDGCVKHVQGQIAACAEKHAAAIGDMHTDRVNELRGLIQKRTRIEKDIVEATAELHEAYEQSRELFDAVLDARMQEHEEDQKHIEDITKRKWGRGST
ncbi:hypothetical protein LTR05_000655 [Lithohypha guttulata]|uniref:Uncharacterized protein n=1 Tax=Lithohypha guttulata TaxID=1690604 RepID=A0AAN7YJK0_9EURO|nr:hypothetical protein LTR05_000655 [Lithohypha guttulata]